MPMIRNDINSPELLQHRYIFLTDDSGIGNGHAEPNIDCYVVTRLDQLIARVLAGIVGGHRVEPKQGEIIRTVGSYDRGRCKTTQLQRTDAQVEHEANILSPGIASGPSDPDMKGICR